MANQDLIKHLDDDSFSQTISQGVTLVDFSAEWCSPCQMLLPVLEEVAKEMQGKAIIAKVDTDKSQKTASSFNITSVPTLILFKEGKEHSRTTGLKDQDDLRELITNVL